MLPYLSRCDIAGYGAAPPPNSNLAAWDVAGIWTKIEDQQRTQSQYCPTTYDHTLGSQANTVYGQLDRFTWYKGIQYPLNWGEVESKTNGILSRSWTEPDRVMNIVGDLYVNSGRTSAQGKKVIFIISTKSFSLASITDILPDYLRTTGATNYSNGVTRYDRAIGFTAPGTGDGYHIRLDDFRDGLTGNDRNGDPIYTLRDAYLAFLQAVHDRYKNHPAFGGIVTAEPTPIIDAEMMDASEFDRNQHFAGRLRLLKYMKGIFTKHLVAEACNFDVQWVTDMTGQNATDGLAANKIAFINPNFHTGLNLRAIYNAADYLDGIVPIINSCQGLDMDSKTGQVKRTGADNDVYDFLPNPPNYGRPRVSMENPGYVNGVWTTHDPPDMPWIIHRAIYLRTNLLMYQHNYATVGPASRFNAPRYNWVDFYTAMNNNTTLLSPNTGGLIQNDPAGGMVTARPLYIAGD